MSKSRSNEIIALLWLIAGYTIGGWFRWFALIQFVENVIEGCYFAYKETKATPSTQAKGGNNDYGNC